MRINLRKKCMKNQQNWLNLFGATPYSHSSKISNFKVEDWSNAKVKLTVVLKKDV